MSAFIVSNKTMNQAIEAIREVGRVNGLKYKGMYLDDSDNLKLLGDELFRLNAEAVSQRYRNPPRETNFKFEWQDCNKCQALKSLQCLIYQCSEGNVLETELYKFLNECERAIVFHIIAKLPEYKAAKWDAE